MTRSFVLAILLALLTLWPVVRWPGDVSWCIDEPRLIANAWHANNEHQLVAHGLYGNFGVCYSPVPSQIYQALLAITHDPFKLVVLRGLLSATVTAFSLLWLARTLRLPAWFAAAILIAPNIIAFHRILWDASFTIPFGALALAAFADFLETQRKWPLRLALAAAVQCALIHPQSLPLSLPIIGTIILRHRGALRGDSRGLLWTAGVLLIFNGKGLVIAFGALCWRLTHGAITSYPLGVQSRWESALAPLLGGNLLTGFGYGNAVNPPGPDWLVTAAKWSSRLIYPLIWLGIAVALRRVVPLFRRGENARAAAGRDILCGAALAGLAVQALLYGGLRLPSAEQYFFGTFALHVFFAWLAVDTLRRLGALAGGLFGLGCAFIALGGTGVFVRPVRSEPGWPTIRSAVAAVEALNRYGDEMAYSDIPDIQKYPQTLRTMRLLIPPPDRPRPVSGRLLITWSERDGRKTGEIVVVEMPEAPPPSRIKMNITPLPADWVPDPQTW